ncbi:SGNH/GDSL hydrolase family protein [Listeria rocourtiae]|uniref:SGNH/GDSL hydrolase family protein n=1 Tax=Listeria rocourtiae TaxID=647910 RepID=UPI003D2F7363
MTIKLNRPINMLQGGSYRDALNENWEMLETWIAENGTEGLHDFLASISTVGGEQLARATITNLFDKIDVDKNTGLVKETGNTTVEAGVNTSRFIKVTPEQIIGTTMNAKIVGCYYDFQKRYIGFMQMTEVATDWYTQCVPVGASYVRVVVTDENLDSYMLSQRESKPEQYYEHEISLPHFNSSKLLYGSRVVTFGDSITWYDGKVVDGVLYRGYQAYMRQAGASIRNEGEGYLTFAPNTKTGSIYEQIVTNKYDLTDFDIVTIAAGTNDIAFNIPLGVVGGRNDTFFDTSTSLGALRAIIEYIRINYPKTEIYLFTPLQNKTRDMDKHEIITDGIIAVADIYGLPRLDLFRKSGLGKYTYDSYTRDGLHPNNAGFDMIGKRIVRMMESS